MQGTIVRVAVTDGQRVEDGDLIIVLEAMKMEQALTAHRPGTVRGLACVVGATIGTGTVICEITD
jgi:acetyl-CoA/propionyl-CoA carboxylase biotin carboxyl carrier protein